jgi:hypothetical protein
MRPTLFQNMRYSPPPAMIFTGVFAYVLLAVMAKPAGRFTPHDVTSPSRCPSLFCSVCASITDFFIFLVTCVLACSCLLAERAGRPAGQRPAPHGHTAHPDARLRQLPHACDSNDFLTFDRLPHL